MHNALILGRDQLRELERRLRTRPTRIWGACLSVFTRLLIEANHSSGTAPDGRPIGRGEVLTSYGRLQERTGLGEKTVRNAIATLSCMGELQAVDRAVFGARKGTVYRLVNYDSYDQSRRSRATHGAGEAATSKEDREKKKYLPQQSCELLRDELTDALPGDLLQAIDALGYDLSQNNMQRLLDSSLEHGEDTIWYCVRKIQTRIENSGVENPGGLFHHMIAGGMFQNEEDRIIEDRWS